MLVDILRIVRRDGFIRRTKIAEELGLDETLVDDGLGQLIRMGYLTEEQTGFDCTSLCSGCPYAKSCGKEIVKTYKLQDKGIEYLGNMEVSK